MLCGETAACLHSAPSTGHSVGLHNYTFLVALTPCVNWKTRRYGNNVRLLEYDSQ